MKPVRAALNLAVLVFFGFALVACAPAVYTDSDPDEDFARLRTFTWAKNPPLIKTGDHPISALTAANMADALKAEFQRKGYRFVPTGAADFAVSFTMGARDKIELRQYPAPYVSTYDAWAWGGRYYGPGYRVPYTAFGPPMTQPEPVSVTEGTFSVDVFDTRIKRPIWHAQAKKRLNDAELAGASAQRLAQAAQTILKEFPARTAPRTDE
ncbi:DUF4136 domain-containing protein [Rhodobacteraceae bacterium F11138]|nr:DUF4136 domain-containing protein [Rhodobacteraceae bacterium F11138]